MKKIILLFLIVVCTQNTLSSQTVPYNVVFDLTSGNTQTHQRVIRWINLILQTHPDAKIEVVFYGGSLTMVETDKTTLSSDIQKLAQSKNVKFAVCEQAMKRHNVVKEMLLPGVGTVPDALYELITKQSEGFGYIKVVD